MLWKKVRRGSSLLEVAVPVTIWLIVPIESQCHYRMITALRRLHQLKFHINDLWLLRPFTRLKEILVLLPIIIVISTNTWYRCTILISTSFPNINFRKFLLFIIILLFFLNFNVFSSLVLSLTSLFFYLFGLFFLSHWIANRGGGAGGPTGLPTPPSHFRCKAPKSLKKGP